MPVDIDAAADLQPGQKVDANIVENTDGYQNVIPVESDRLCNTGINQQSCRSFAASQSSSPLNLIEFFHAVPYFPIAFTRQNTGYQPCVIMGLSPGKNLFTDALGNWVDGVYCPAYIRRYPFITQAITAEELQLQDDEIRKPIFVDESALDKNAGSLFIANNTKTDEWKAIESFVSEYISAERQTLKFTNRLDELNLLQPFDAQIHQKKADMLRLKGLYRINEDKLNQLPGDVVKALMKSGELSRIYAHLISLENFAKLLDRKAEKDSCKF